MKQTKAKEAKGQIIQGGWQIIRCQPLSPARQVHDQFS
jgi:hypothetical protein